MMDESIRYSTLKNKYPPAFTYKQDIQHYQQQSNGQIDSYL